jgi:uncharacterized protein YcaQ
LIIVMEHIVPSPRRSELGGNRRAEVVYDPEVPSRADTASMTAAPISREVARRYLAIHHLLAPPRSLPAGPKGVLAAFDRLGSIQFDPIDVAGRNHDLVLLARVEGYRREVTDLLLYEERSLFEAYNKGLSLVPTAELPSYRITWDRARARHAGGAFDEHAPLVEELLDRIRSTGPMAATDVPAQAAIEWYWRPTNQVRAVLEALAEAGILGVSRRDGNRRVYDLVERLFPADLLQQRTSPREAFRHKLRSRYRAHGLLGRSGTAELWLGTSPRIGQLYGLEGNVPEGAPGRRALHAELLEEGALIQIRIEGLRRERYAPAESLPLLQQAEREIAAGEPPGGAAPGVAFLAPLDPLVWDREFLRTLFGFDYLWEVYVPASKRRWGYYVLPVLFGDRLVGRIEPRIDRKANELRIAALWWEPDFDPLAAEGFVDAFGAAVAAHVAFGGVGRITWPPVARHRQFVRAVTAAISATARHRDRGAARS